MNSPGQVHGPRRPSKWDQKDDRGKDLWNRWVEAWSRVSDSWCYVSEQKRCTIKCSGIAHLTLLQDYNVTFCTVVGLRCNFCSTPVAYVNIRVDVNCSF